MTHLVTEACINCKYTDCVEVCPVDCFYEGNNMLVINPDECIDCGVCREACPVMAILADFEMNTEELATNLEINTKYSKKWAHKRITVKKHPMPEAEKFKDTPNKLSMLDPSPAAE